MTFSFTMMKSLKMMVFALVLHFILGAFCYVNVADALPLVSDPADIEYKRYCSSTLAEAIHLICNGRTNPVVAQKLNEQTSYIEADILKRSTSHELFYRPLNNGPIHECCRRPCGYTELKQYCAPD